MPALTEPAKLVLVPGARALARFEAGHLDEVADAARAAEADARRLGFGQHFFAIDYLLALAGVALERRDLDTAEQFTEQVASASRTWPRAAQIPARSSSARNSKAGRPYSDRESGDPMTAGMVGGALEAARRGGFLNTVVTTAPQVTSYLVEHSAQVRPDPFMEQLISAALAVRAAQPDASRSCHALIEPLTPAELRILKLLPTSTYLQMAATLYVSRNTVKTHLRSIYQKLGVTSRSEAIERAVDLRLL